RGARAGGRLRAPEGHHDRGERGFHRVPQGNGLERDLRRGLRGARTSARGLPKEPVSFRSPPPGEDPARAARELLAPALAELQRNRAPTALGTHALDHVAAAMSALYGAEAESRTEAAATASLRRALDARTRRLDELHERTPGLHALDGPATAVARAMALLYPRVRLSERQRRGVVMSAAAPHNDDRS